MKKFLLGFLCVIVFYHVIHTVVLWGMDIGNPVIISSIKELIWFAFIVFACVFWHKQAWSFLKKWKWLVLALLVLIGWSFVLSRYEGVHTMTMIVGFKYDLLPLLILVSAIFLGTILRELPEAQVERSLLLLGSIVIVCGLLWQIGKIVLPDFFHMVGYGPVGDYALASAPPLYYRTGPGGWMRLQGLFSGPNNYGYFLVAYASVLIGWRVTKKKGGKNTSSGYQRLLGLLFVGSVVRTFSRGALLGILIQVVLLIRFFRPARRRRLRWIIGIGAAGIVGLSFLKPASTIGHLSARVDGRSSFVAQPQGYGLGSSGPAIHRDGVYLPENHYLQILLDIGIPGVLLWLFILVGVIVCGWSRQIIAAERITKLRMLLLIGLIGLLVEGLFLHVFEDSMVNYLFLVVVGGVVGMKSDG